MNHAACAIGRCKAEPDLVCWTVPICQPHWSQCCAEEPGCSLEWLRRKVRREFVRDMPAPLPVPRRVEPVAQRVLRKPVRVTPPREEPRKPVRLVRKPVRISKR